MTICEISHISNLPYLIALPASNSHNVTLTIVMFILISLLMFIHITQDKSKLDNLLYQKHVQTQVLK